MAQPPLESPVTIESLASVDSEAKHKKECALRRVVPPLPSILTIEPNANNKHKKNPSGSDDDMSFTVTVNAAGTSDNSQHHGVNPLFASMAAATSANFSPQETALLSKAAKRTFLVGDVHACLKELHNLLDTVKYNPLEDDLILLGDLVGKGPDSRGVLAFAMSTPRCYALIGNHDWTLLRWYDAYKAGETEVLYSSKPGNPYVQMGQELSNEEAAYLRALPHVILLPHYRAIGVHAGLNPYIFANPPPPSTGTDTISAETKPCLELLNYVDGLVQQYGGGGTTANASSLVSTSSPSTSYSLEARAIVQSNSYDMMHQRNAIDSLQETSETILGSGPWAERWRGSWTVAFGHDALRRLQDRRQGGTTAVAVAKSFDTTSTTTATTMTDTKEGTSGSPSSSATTTTITFGPSLGLDTGCCYGGFLTAWALPEDKLVQHQSAFSCLKEKK